MEWARKYDGWCFNPQYLDEALKVDVVEAEQEIQARENEAAK